MKRVRFRLPVSLPVTDSQLALLEAAAPLVRTIREHAPALRTVGKAAGAFVKAADVALAAERSKRKRAKKR